MAIFSLFNPTAKLLTVFGDNLDNGIEVGRDAAGTIKVNGGAVATVGGTPTVANTQQITVFGLGGNDVITLNETNGALPRAQLFAGAGDDRVTGGSGADQLFGQAGNDVLNGKGGNDFLFGGTGNDVLTGGDGDDQVFGEAGDDRFIWSPGDDTDLYEGGTGFDTTQVRGGNGTEVFSVAANGVRVRLDRVDPAPFSIDMGTMEKLELNMGGGDDTFSATGNLAALIKITVDGGAGNDTILGSNGNDRLLGGTGDDFIDGQQGDDVAFLGAGEDVFQWDPGDGSDKVDGGDGFDTMLFNGSGGNEIMELKPSGGRAIFTRDLANIVMQLDEVEQVTVNALGGEDLIIIRDTTGTDVQAVNVNLAGTIGGVVADGQADTVIVEGRGGDDFLDVLGTAGDLLVLGNDAVFVADAEADKDRLVVNGLGGDDRISASSMGAGNVMLTLDGGAGNDTLFGSGASDVLIGGAGNDFIDGNQGDDLMLLGAGDDIAVWDPGEGSDVVEGGQGQDSLRFIGSNAAENFAILANGGRVLLTRDLDGVTMDLDDVEGIDLLMFGGADDLVIGDLSGTDVKQIAVNMGAVLGSPATDAAADTVRINGTNGADVIEIVDVGTTSLSVVGLSADVAITRIEAALDQLVLNGGGGADVIDASALGAGVVNLTMDGGLGDDVFIGSGGDDVIAGGDGDDTAFMGDGDDVFFWAPGDDDDTVEGEAGFDEMLFAGANVAETINIFANGGRVLFTRDIANVTMDLNDVEKVTFEALGGADSITVQDLSGTDVGLVSINLGAFIGGDDGQADTVTINATEGDDVIVVVSDGNGQVRVLGLAAEVQVFNFGVGDRLVINGFGGDDVIDASALDAELLLRVNGLEGDDVLIGGAGDDIITGGNGDDVLIGGPGLDTLLGGAGDNVIIQ
jgi:Ca2+-binding RTX toxin-like protein